MQTQDKISNLLKECRIIAVVGLSPKPHRASNDVSAYMQRHGYKIVPVNPNYAGTHILGELCYVTLTDVQRELDKTGDKIDIVDCFRRAETLMPIAEEAIAVGARCLWLQLGIENEEVEAKAEQAGLWVVMDRCIKIDHMRMEFE